MCPMLDVQRQQATVFRIRFGAQEGEGKSRHPVKLTDAIRVTADNREVVEAFTAVYGGETREWKPDKHRNEWEAYLPTTSLRIILLPGQSLTQWWELWKGSVCERRCDSVTEQKSKGACKCTVRDPADRTAAKGQCNPVTRVHVICPDVAVIGSGMFICNGLIGAATLPESIANADAALRAGIFVPATLTVVEHRGRNHFITPRIETVGVSMFELLEAAAEKQASGELGAGERILGGLSQPDFKAIAAAPKETVPPLREQLGQVDQTTVRQPRANAAQPIPPTNMTPRPVAGDPGVIDVEAEEEDDDRPPASDVNHVAIWAREAGLDDDGRHLLAEWASDGAWTSSTQLDDAARERAHDACQRIKAGTARLDRDETGAAVLLDSRFGWKTDGRSTLPTPAAGDSPFTMDEIDGMNGPTLQRELGLRELEKGGTLPEMRARLAQTLGLSGEEPFA